MKRIHQRFANKRQHERESRAQKRQEEYEKFFGASTTKFEYEGNGE